MKLLIDGENLRHQIADVLFQYKKITDKNAYFKFDLANFCKDVLNNKSVEIVYYTTKIKQPRYQKIPLKLSKRIHAISVANRQWIANLTNQGIKIVKAGHLRVRESNMCVHCGKKTLVLQEKGVDVRVATDLVLVAQQKAKKVALGPSDSDLLPALEAATALGVEVTYFCYGARLNNSVAGKAHKIITFDDATVLKYSGK